MCAAFTKKYPFTAQNGKGVNYFVILFKVINPFKNRSADFFKAVFAERIYKVTVFDVLFYIHSAADF